MPDYPILQQNKPIGTLTVTQEGLFTVFSARAKRTPTACGSPGAASGRARISA